jgi:organic hydroperoxide reductase OsmC/OhrA
MNRRHSYSATISWTGDRGQGTSTYRAYERSYDIAASGKPSIAGSSDPAFRGDRACWNPEELLVASLSACHQLWYLHLCADAGVVVVAYQDEAQGTMVEEASGSGQMEQVTLHPRVTVSAGSDREVAARLHEDAHKNCFIARSVNFPVHCEPIILGAEEDAVASA